jgi:multiple sugar transport system permease protein
MIASSLKAPDELTRLPPTWLPAHPNLDAFGTVFSVIPYAQAFLNSFIIAAGDTVAIVVTSVMAGFVFAKYRFRGRDLLFYAVLGTMFVPTIVTIVPTFHVIQALGLVDSLFGVMLPQLANAFGIFLMRQFIAGVPDELLDAARVDGASEWTVLWRVVTPLLVPAVATLVLFAFVFQWNSFLWPLTVLQSEDKFTVVLAMSRLLSYTSSIQFQNVVMAGAVISVLPNMILFLFLQRYFVSSLARTGLTG